MSNKTLLESQLKQSRERQYKNGHGARSVQYVSVGPGSPLTVNGQIVDESFICLSINGEELATLMCSPRDLEDLALGFLYNERLIEEIDDLRSIHLSKNGTCVDVWLKDIEFVAPRRKIITAGCGGGITFDDLTQEHDPLNSDLRASPNQLAGLMKKLHIGAELYQQARGIHTAVLAEGDAILLQVEDVGRHNCLDKLAGAALRSGIPTRNRILLSSGRISSEMINKARRLATPIICSRTSPTNLSVELARTWNMTVVAYLRQDRMRVYTHPERILG